MKRQQVNNVVNIKDDEGNWLKGYTINGIRYQTRSCILWNNINLRCKPDGAHQKRRPTYIDTVNNFVCYQEFTSWCEDSFGLYTKNHKNNEFWALDKDIALLGNKTYSPEFCIFVPKEVNSLFTIRQNHRGDYPIGVVKAPRKFAKSLEYFGRDAFNFSGVSNKGFYDPLSAHRFWQESKMKAIEFVISSEEVLGHLKLIQALGYRLQILKDDFALKRETKVF